MSQTGRKRPAQPAVSDPARTADLDATGRCAMSKRLSRPAGCKNMLFPVTGPHDNSLPRPASQITALFFS